MNKPSQTVNAVFLALWFASLAAVPAIRMSTAAFGWPQSDNGVAEEKREPAKIPVFSEIPAKQWGHAVDAWFNDTFPFRGKVVGFYKHLCFHIWRSPIGYRVPGVGGTIFLREGTWPELDDYLGAIPEDGEMLRDWRTLLEGRAAWAEAHGAHYLEVVTPVKIQVHPELAPWAIRGEAGQSSRQRLELAMRGSFAESNIVFLTGRFRAEALGGRELFYEDDHHVNAYGCWLIYDSIVAAIRERWFPQLTGTPYFENPPESVRRGEEAGAFTDPDTHTLEVSAPGYSPCPYREIGIRGAGRAYPQIHVRVRREGQGLKVAMRHDSFLRYPLSSWESGRGYPSLAIPLGTGFSDVAMFIFRRFSTEELGIISGVMAPDVIIEQFPECKISQGVFGLDDTMRRAAEFGRATAVPNDHGGGGHFLAMASFADVLAEKGTDGEVGVAIVDADGQKVAAGAVAPGRRRAVFFGEIAGNPPFAIRLTGGKASESRLELRR